MEEESHCAVVFRGGLMMQTMDCSPASKMKGMDEVKTTAFVLCTVQEIVHPYALIFSVEHPGTFEIIKVGRFSTFFWISTFLLLIVCNYCYITFLMVHFSLNVFLC